MKDIASSWWRRPASAPSRPSSWRWLGGYRSAPRPAPRGPRFLRGTHLVQRSPTATRIIPKMPAHDRRSRHSPTRDTAEAGGGRPRLSVCLRVVLTAVRPTSPFELGVRLPLHSLLFVCPREARGRMLAINRRGPEPPESRAQAVRFGPRVPKRLQSVSAMTSATAIVRMSSAACVSSTRGSADAGGRPGQVDPRS